MISLQLVYLDNVNLFRNINPDGLSVSKYTNYKAIKVEAVLSILNNYWENINKDISDLVYVLTSIHVCLNRFKM